MTGHCRKCGLPPLDLPGWPADFCERHGHCQARWTTPPTWSRLAQTIATIPRRRTPHRPLPAPEVTALPSLRPNTPDRNRDGETVSTTKRACNGCGQILGDATDEELKAHTADLPLPDVRGECLACAHLVAVTGASVGDEVLYRWKPDGTWVMGFVEALGPTGGQIAIRLVRGALAVEVTHGFDVHQWCTLDELVEHRKVVARDQAGEMA